MKRTIAVLILAWVGCRQRPVVTAAAEGKHLVALYKPKECLYLDHLDNRVILQHADTAGPTTFCSFLVGLADSLPLMDAQRKLDRERYIQYTLQQDWTAIVAGDSLKPVFFQEKPSLKGQLKEGALVFELPRGRRADTLVYRDTFGDWGTQVFILNAQ